MPWLPVWAWPGAPWVLAALALGLVLDAIYPWHGGLLLRIHPVATAYHLALRLAGLGESRAWGVIVWLTVVSSHLLLYSLILYAAWLASPLAWLAAAAWIVKVSCPLTPLLDAVEKFRACVEKGDWVCGRRVAQGLVRRNVATLDEPHVVSAVLESLAESLVDGYTSPLFYYTLLGPLGALTQRLVNTLDSAIGYPEPPFRETGWFSARMDDLINWIPARLTTVMLIASAALLGLDWRASLHSWLEWRGATPSPNAGHPISALAGALRVWLEKPGYYTINPGADKPVPSRTKPAARLATLTALLHTLATTTAILAAPHP